MSRTSAPKDPVALRKGVLPRGAMGAGDEETTAGADGMPPARVPAEPSREATPIKRKAKKKNESGPEAAAPASRPSPLVRKLAAESGLDPSLVAGSGEGGRVTKDDMLAAMAPALRAAQSGHPGHRKQRYDPGGQVTLQLVTR